MITLFIILAFLQTVAVGAVLGRVDGGGIAKVNEWVERFLIMFYFVAACIPFAGFWSAAAAVGMIGLATGHGQYFLNLAVKAVKPERVDFILRLFFDRDPRTVAYDEWRDDNWKTAPGWIKDQIFFKMQEYSLRRLYWRNVAGMFLTGFLVGLPAAIIAICFNQPIGLLFLLTGPAKAFAYAIGHKIWNNTESAEFINGGLRNAICSTVILLTLFSGL